MESETKMDVNQSVGQPKPELLQIDFYKEICNNIRVTDDISFKLLNIVPVMSGIGSAALVFLEKSQLLIHYSGYAVISLSICGALITFGLLKWELRNIQKCKWLIQCAEDFELRLFKNVEIERQSIQFAGFKNNDTKISSIFDTPWGKTQAEKLIYCVAIVVWLVPIAIVLHKIWLTYDIL